ncbi:MAG TPA: VWA domain-containing protein [Gemmatimonadaceae bacterium]|nr:VWA domain-containing protein [Gemmatimonadaceae bacterium]
MISFLSPLFLLAAAAAAIPLLIHLMRRRIGTRMEFPAVRYLARAEREHSRKLRLRNLLLMLLRLAAVLLIALAAARPIARVGGGSHAPTALAVVLDNSLSSTAIQDGRPVLDVLRAAARGVVSRAGASDRVWLVTADAVVHGDSRAAVLDAIARTDALGGAGEPERALERAAAVVRRSSLDEREVVVVTDGQRTAWRAPVSLGDVRLAVYRAPGDPPVNRAIVAAQADPVRWTPRGAVRARALTPDSAIYRIALEGRTLARGTAARDEEIIVRAAPAERGWTAGSVALEPDEMRADDERPFAVWIGPAPAVAVDESAGPFVGTAVAALMQAERVAAGSDVRVASAERAARLPALLLAPSDPVRVGAANRALERLGVPWRFGARRTGRWPARGARMEGATVLARYELDHRSGDASDTLATAGGAPWIVAGPGYVLVASPLMPDATDLTVRAAFVPWLDDVLTQRLGGARGAVIEATPRAVVERPPGSEMLVLPGGERLPLSGDSVEAPARAGVSFFEGGGERVGALVVAPEADESVLDRLDERALRDRLRAREARVVSDADALAHLVFASAPRRYLAAPLLALALAALAVETALVGGRRRGAMGADARGGAS